MKSPVDTIFTDDEYARLFPTGRPVEVLIMDDLNNFDNPTNFVFHCQHFNNRRSEWPLPRMPYSMEPEALTRLRQQEAVQVLGQGNAIRMVPVADNPGKNC